MKLSLPAAALAALPLLLVQHAAPAATAMDDAAKMNYALGYQLGRDLAGAEFRPDAMVKGVEDARAGKPSALTDAEMQASLTALQQKISEQRAKAQAEIAQKVAAAGGAYLAQNAKKPGVTVTKSGLQYKVITPGSGRSPGPNDTVTVHYSGTLVDGTEFDSSYKRGQPATFPVSGVIAGWTEALQLMKEGAKFELAIPPNLAYADRGPLANQVLLFSVELIKVEAGQPAK
jgi:FKBP-type peptidyl-prolyl cis-trans isomerase FklB